MPPTRRWLVNKDFPSGESHQYEASGFKRNLISAHSRTPSDWTINDDHELIHYVERTESNVPQLIFDKMNVGPHRIIRAGLQFLRIAWPEEDLSAFDKAVKRHGFAKAFGRGAPPPQWLAYYRVNVIFGRYSTSKNIPISEFAYPEVYASAANSQSKKFDSKSKIWSTSNDALTMALMHEVDDRARRLNATADKLEKVSAMLEAKASKLRELEILHDKTYDQLKKVMKDLGRR